MPVCRLSFSPAASPSAARQSLPATLAALEIHEALAAKDACEEAAETLSLACSEELDMGRSPAVSLAQQLSPIAHLATGALHSLSMQVQLVSEHTLSVISCCLAQFQLYACILRLACLSTEIMAPTRRAARL